MSDAPELCASCRPKAAEAPAAAPAARTEAAPLPGPKPRSAVFLSSWGAVMLAASAFWAAKTSYEARDLARGSLIFALVSFAAAWMNARGRPVVAGLLVAAGFGACVVSGARGVTNSGWFMAKGVADQTRGNLGSIRSALSIYYGDMGGSFPPSLDSLTVGGKYLQTIPRAQVPAAHQASAAVALGQTPDDAGGWLYNNDPASANVGNVMVNCTHTDGKGATWASY